MLENDAWCPLPWIFQAVRNNGDVRVCCQANASESKGILRKNDGSVYNVKHDNLNEARNAPLIKELRLAMLENRKHPVCIRCHQEDSSGIRSRRVYEKENWSEFFDIKFARKSTAPDGSIDPAIVKSVYYDIRLGNHCNLKCRMCGPTDSSAWYSDQVQVWGPSYKDSHGKVDLVKNDRGTWAPRNNDYAWIDSPNFWLQIEQNIPNIRHIHTVGGEPLLIDKHFDLLEKCIASDAAKNITIEYNSNITVIPDRAWAIWSKFRSVNIGISLDGYGKVNDYIRYPSKWSKIEANIDRLDSAPGNFRVWLSTTVQAYNILHLPELLKWRLSKKFKRVNNFQTQPLITTHPLHNPKHLSVKMLPKEYKLFVDERFDFFLHWLTEWLPNQSFNKDEQNNLLIRSKKLLSSYQDFMHSEDWSSQIPQFWSYTKKLDQIRSQSFRSVFPELNSAIANYISEMNQAELGNKFEFISQ